MKNNSEPSQQLNEIHDMMLRSSRFISLSGLSGISAGIIALAGVLVVIILYGTGMPGSGPESFPSDPDYLRIRTFVISDALIVLSLALVSSIYFTTREARKKGLKVWDSTARRLIVNLFLPLMAGGILCLALFFHGLEWLVPAVTLTFYGMALINASKYTLHEIRLLGIFETILGLIASFLPGYSLIFWAAGFGLLHIIYGSFMYYKYEYKSR